MNPEYIKELQETISYNPETGDLRWKVSPSRAIKKGQRCKSVSHGYIRVKCLGKEHKGHRLAWAIMTGIAPPARIDHKNGIGTDNRWKNLREASHQQNMFNSKVSKNNQSGLKGVGWHKENQMWVARVFKDGKNHQKYFHDQEKAFEWACQKREELHGGFARHQ